MELWQLGLVVLIVVGVAIIAYGALRDRQLNRRRAAEMLAPPQRPIPNLRQDAEAPRYLSELQARRPPAGVPPLDLTEDQRTVTRDQLAAATSIPCGYAGAGFVTDSPSGLAVLDHPRVLVCADPVTTIRELIPLLERLAASGEPLVLLAPELSDEVVTTLEVNVIQRKLAAVAVRAPGESVARIATLVGAHAVDRADRQAGAYDPGMLGSADRWMSSATTSYVIVNR